VLLKPGEQGVLQRTGGQVATGPGGRLRVLDNVNTDDVVAWKNGVFVFGDKKDLKAVMREFARWYNVEVEYEGTIPAIEMHGKCSRDLTASEALKILSYTTSLQFRIGDRKIVVSGGR
jgi:transmembrane sensor